jgi:DNA polymerase III delta prime subunit
MIINLLLTEYNYCIKKIHSSEMKSKTIVKEIIYSCTKTIDMYSSLKSTHNINNYAIIIDDTESVTLTSEKNNIIELFKINNENKYFPLIFINNLQQSKLITELRKSCMEIFFNPPAKNDLKKYIDNILKDQNIIINEPKIIEIIIKFAQNDLRRLINILQDLYFTFENNEITFDMFKNFLLISHKKDIDIGLKDASVTVLNKYNKINYTLQLYEREKVPLPLMIFENYYNKLIKSKISFEKILNIMVNISDSISVGDMIETNIYSDQNWYLQSIHGFITCVNTSYHINNGVNNKVETSDIEWSLDLHKTSLKNINRKNIYNLQNILKKNTLDDILFMNKYFVEINNKLNNLINKKIIKQDKNIKNINRQIYNKIKNNYDITNRNIDIIMNLDKTIKK